MLSLAILSTLLGTSLTIFLVTPSRASPAPPPLFAYTAKWICNFQFPLNVTGFSPLNAELIGLVPGEYKTDINVHNPSSSTTNATIRENFVISQAQYGLEGVHFPPGPFVSSKGETAFGFVTLGPNAALFIDCFAIYLAFFNNGIRNLGVAKGFAVLISSASDLNVVVEHSSQSFNSTSTCLPPTCGSTGTSLEVESVPALPFVP